MEATLQDHLLKKLKKFGWYVDEFRLHPTPNGKFEFFIVATPPGKDSAPASVVDKASPREPVADVAQEEEEEEEEEDDDPNFVTVLIEGNYKSGNWTREGPSIRLESWALDLDAEEEEEEKIENPSPSQIKAAPLQELPKKPESPRYAAEPVVSPRRVELAKVLIPTAPPSKSPRAEIESAITFAAPAEPPPPTKVPPPELKQQDHPQPTDAPKAKPSPPSRENRPKSIASMAPVEIPETPVENRIRSATTIIMPRAVPEPVKKPPVPVDPFEPKPASPAPHPHHHNHHHGHPHQPQPQPQSPQMTSQSAIHPSGGSPQLPTVSAELVAELQSRNKRSATTLNLTKMHTSPATGLTRKPSTPQGLPAESVSGGGGVSEGVTSTAPPPAAAPPPMLPPVPLGIQLPGMVPSQPPQPQPPLQESQSQPAQSKQVQEELQQATTKDTEALPNSPTTTSPPKTTGAPPILNPPPAEIATSSIAGRSGRSRPTSSYDVVKRDYGEVVETAVTSLEEGDASVSEEVKKSKRRSFHLGVRKSGKLEKEKVDKDKTAPKEKKEKKKKEKKTKKKDK